MDQPVQRPTVQQMQQAQLQGMPWSHAAGHQPAAYNSADATTAPAAAGSAAQLSERARWQEAAQRVADLLARNAQLHEQPSLHQHQQQRPQAGSAVHAAGSNAAQPVCLPQTPADFPSITFAANPTQQAGQLAQRVAPQQPIAQLQLCQHAKVPPQLQQQPQQPHTAPAQPLPKPVSEPKRPSPQQRKQQQKQQLKQQRQKQQLKQQQQKQQLKQQQQKQQQQNKQKQKRQQQQASQKQQPAKRQREAPEQSVTQISASPPSKRQQQQQQQQQGQQQQEQQAAAADPAAEAAAQLLAASPKHALALHAALAQHDAWIEEQLQKADREFAQQQAALDAWCQQQQGLEHAMVADELVEGRQASPASSQQEEQQAGDAQQQQVGGGSQPEEEQEQQQELQPGEAGAPLLLQLLATHFAGSELVPTALSLIAQLNERCAEMITEFRTERVVKSCRAVQLEVQQALSKLKSRRTRQAYVRWMQHQAAQESQKQLQQQGRASIAHTAKPPRFMSTLTVRIMDMRPGAGRVWKILVTGLGRAWTRKESRGLAAAHVLEQLLQRKSRVGDVPLESVLANMAATEDELESQAPDQLA